MRVYRLACILKDEYVEANAVEALIADHRNLPPGEKLQIAESLEKILKSTSRAQIRHLGLYVQTKRNGTLALSGSSGAAFNRSNLTKSKSNLSRFVKTLASERFLPNGTTIDFLINKPVDDHTAIANTLKKTVEQKNMHELSPAERQLALNEVTLLSRLDHPNIISYYDSFAEDGVLMIEMEYAEGGTLAQLLARREDYLEEAEIMYLFEQMVSAVAYLHDNEILHRYDNKIICKSKRFQRSQDNLVKIGDFGISKIMGAETKVQGAQTILGTPYYLSPEMANYEQVKGPYSNELKLLIRDIFKTNPEQRPTALDVLRNVQRHRAIKNKTAKRPNFVESPRPAICYSVLYQFDIEKVTLSAVPTLPNRINIKQTLK
ncbi:Protein kinase domain-containing protein [Aphelenchoides besseyi]|nr:Protein kinase domain-containing protein [Aphelenchoides besseyi]